MSDTGLVCVIDDDPAVRGLILSNAATATFDRPSTI
jgi:hypothetical protein